MTSAWWHRVGLPVVAVSLAGCAGLAEGPAATSPGAAAVAALRFPPLALRVPRVGVDVARHVLPNGLVIYLTEDRSLPRVRFTAIARSGFLYEPRERAGVATLLGSQLRAGGTTRLSADALTDELETMGASLESDAGTEHVTLTLQVLSKDWRRGLGLLADILQRPAFEEAKLALAKERLKESLRREDDNPRAILRREGGRALYTEAHPLGIVLTPALVDAVGRGDLAAFHAARVRPSQAFLAVVGDFDASAMLAALTREFGEWAGTPAPAPVVPTPPAPSRRVVLVEKALEQTSVAMTHFGIPRGDPDQPAAELMNYILGGGGLSARIPNRVRTQEGLAYTVGTSLTFGVRTPGTFRASLQTKPASSRRAIDLTLEEIARMREEGVSEEELAATKESFINSLVFSFASKADNVVRLMRLEIDGLPSDHYDGLLDRYRAVTREEVQRVARRLLQVERLIIVVVGDPKAFDKPLDGLGPVTRVVLPAAGR
jgi:predicted Zn-dependent peptidase